MFKDNPFSAYTSKLPASISKDDAEISIGNIRKEMSKNLKLTLASFSKYRDKREMKSLVGKEIDKRCVGLTKSPLHTMIKKGMDMLSKKLDQLEEAASGHLEDDNPKSQLTYDQVYVLKFITLSGFWVEYSISIMRYVAANEVAEMDNSEPGYAKAFAKRIEENLKDYLLVTDIILSKTDIAKTIDNISNTTIVVEDRFVNNSGTDKDPLRLGFLGTYFNPLYVITSMFAAYQLWRHDYLTTTKNEVILYIQYLESIDEANGGGDPRIKDKLEKQSENLKTIEYKLKKIEEDIME